MTPTPSANAPVHRAARPGPPARRLVRNVAVAVFAFAFAACGIAGGAVAAGGIGDEDGPARPGPFLQLGLTLGVPSYGWLDELDAQAAAAGAAALAVPGTGSVDTGWSSTNLLGFDVAAGWRLTRRWAVDASFEWARGDLWADVVVRTATQRLRTQQRRNEIESWVALVNGRYYVTTGRLQPYLTAGIGAMLATPVDLAGRRRDAHGFASRLGGGLDFYVTRQFAATAAAWWNFATGDTAGSDSFGFRAGLTWRR